MSKDKLKQVKYVPKTNINYFLELNQNLGLEEYLLVKTNLEIFTELFEGSDDLKFTPLEFFNKLYEIFEIVKSNIDRPILVKDYLKGLNLYERDNSCLEIGMSLLFYANIFINRNIKTEKKYLIEADQLEFCLACMDAFPQEGIRKAEQNKKDIEVELLKAEGSYKNNSVSDIENLLEKLPTKAHKIRYLIDTRAIFLKLIAKHGEQQVFFDLANYCAIEIERILLLPEFKKESQKEPPIKKEKLPTTFEELFYDPEIVEPCIGVLKKIEPPILNESGMYMGGLKGAFVVWIDALKKRDFIKIYSDRKIYASLISKKFVSIDESMFGKINPTASKRYSKDIEVLLSQISHERKKGK